jgi:hypothetical protein
MAEIGEHPRRWPRSAAHAQDTLKLYHDAEDPGSIAATDTTSAASAPVMLADLAIVLPG